MPDLLTHYAISYLIASRVLKYRYALFFALIGLLPDIDVLLGVHRWITHSVLIAIVAIGLAALFVLVNTRIYVEYFRYLGLASILYLLHIVLDMFTAPEPLLWPMINKEFMISIVINGCLGHGRVCIYPYLKINVSDINFIPKEVIGGPIVNMVGVITSIVVAMVIILEYLGRAK